ncbi:MAG: DUF3616 domain-containing protein, partial [Verrucomicrobiales bacterium]|nr:DUF3616 domain-containing protein [Verrucomicrobiales bacterium]
RFRPECGALSSASFQALGRCLPRISWLIPLVLCLGALPAESKPKRSKVLEGSNFDAAAGEIVYQGICDASAAVAINANLVVIATDEENRLRLYQRDRGGPPLQAFDVSAHLGLERGPTETDIEGAARLGGCVYWITSHSRNQDGRFRPNRLRFFATTFTSTADHGTMRFLGEAYPHLVSDLARAPELARFDFEKAARLAPKQRGGLNIEGLCATPDNRLLIAFRNPVPNGQALLVPLTNPEQVVMAGQRAKFGEPILLDLDGLGVRDIAYADGRYILIAGSFDGQGQSRLFCWAGGNSKPQLLKRVKLKGLNPEAIAIYPDRGLEEFQLFSDDSSQRQLGKDCSEMKDEFARQFRSVRITHKVEATEPAAH